jgi:WD40 repeat protein
MMLIGGAYFAAANGPVIQLFSTYTCDMLGSFNLHKGKVRSIHWTPDDSQIVTSAMDGSLFQWRLKVAII